MHSGSPLEANFDPNSMTAPLAHFHAELLADSFEVVSLNCVGLNHGQLHISLLICNPLTSTAIATQQHNTLGSSRLTTVQSSRTSLFRKQKEASHLVPWSMTASETQFPAALLADQQFTWWRMTWKLLRSRVVDLANISRSVTLLLIFGDAPHRLHRAPHERKIH